MFSGVMYQYLLNNQIHFIKDLVTFGSAPRKGAPDLTPDKMKKLYYEQLSRVRRLPNGKISGKIGKDGRDDVAMAGGVGLYHERNVAPFVNDIMRLKRPRIT